MIPYDDLVVALQNWRARQGMPVAQLSALGPPPPAMTASTPARTAPPAAPPAKAPPPLAPATTRDEDVDDDALLEEAHYENEGNDFAMAFGQSEHDEATSIGGAPSPTRDSFGGGGTEPERKPGRNDDDW